MTTSTGPTATGGRTAVLGEHRSGRVTAPARRSAVAVLSSEKAIAHAAVLAAEFASAAAERDARRVLPYEEIDRLAESGLLAITVPAAYGGADLPAATVAEVFRRIATGDPNIAQIPHSHFVYVNQLRYQGSPSQQERLFAEVLEGQLLANAQSERSSKHVREHRTVLTAEGPRRWRLDGTKYYCTGAAFADWIPVLAHLGEDGPLHVAWVRRHTPGVEVVDDWDAVGQRTTASGTVRLKDVLVTEEWITPYPAFDGPQTLGAFAQLLHAAIDAGIARAALDDTSTFLRYRSRPYPDAGVERAVDDPLVVHAMGELEVQVRGAEALLGEAARAVDHANEHLTAESAGAASLAVAAARVATTQASVEAGSRLFEICGTRSAAAGVALDRHWRNARTHTLHDPARWKVQHLGRWAIDGTLPPRHGQL